MGTRKIGEKWCWRQTVIKKTRILSIEDYRDSDASNNIGPLKNEESL